MDLAKVKRIDVSRGIGAIKDCEIIVELFYLHAFDQRSCKDKEMVATGMRHEIERCQKPLIPLMKLEKNI